MDEAAARRVAEDVFSRFTARFIDKWGTGPVEPHRVRDLFIELVADALAQAVRGEREPLEKAGRMMMQATDELMTEFVSKKRAANWGVINDALVAMAAALRAPSPPEVTR